MEERHRCKLCSRTFFNGRALGGHMRSHLATLPLPPKTITPHTPPPLTQLNHQLGEKTESNSSSSYTEQEIRKQKVLAFGYGLRENPKKSLKLSDPEFLDAGSDSVVVQDSESETESLQSSPTRSRFKRTQRHAKHQSLSNSKKVKLLSFSEVNSSIPSDSVSEPIQASSVVSEPFPQDEQIALCLMTLSRDVWKQKVTEGDDDDEDSVELNRRGRKCCKCLACKKIFRSNRALNGHRATSKMPQENAREEEGFEPKIHNEDPKIYECPFCYKLFGSGQALGGHQRSHLLGSSNDDSSSADHTRNQKVADSLIDLNLPAPTDDD